MSVNHTLEENIERLKQAQAETRKEDDRQVRQYGNLSCVYNVTRDKIESCAEVGR